MRYPASEKLEIIRIVEQSHLPAKLTLDKLGIGDCQEFCAGGRLPSLDDEALTEDYGELTFGLTPFARWALPFVRRVIEHEI